VIYVMLNELFEYVVINKIKHYIKSVNVIFNDVKSLIKRLKTIVRDDRDIWNNIHIIIIFNSLSLKYDIIKAYIITLKEMQIQKIQ